MRARIQGRYISAPWTARAAGRLGDEVVAKSKWDEVIKARAMEIAARSDRPSDAKGIKLLPLERKISGDTITYPHVRIEIERERGIATVTARAPARAAPLTLEAAHALGSLFSPPAVP